MCEACTAHRSAILLLAACLLMVNLPQERLFRDVHHNLRSGYVHDAAQNSFSSYVFSTRCQHPAKQSPGIIEIIGSFIPNIPADSSAAPAYQMSGWCDHDRQQVHQLHDSQARDALSQTTSKPAESCYRCARICTWSSQHRLSVPISGRVASASWPPSTLQSLTGSSPGQNRPCTGKCAVLALCHADDSPNPKALPKKHAHPCPLSLPPFPPPPPPIFLAMSSLP